MAQRWGSAAKSRSARGLTRFFLCKVGVPNAEAEMSIVVRYAPVPSSTVEQYDEVMRRLQESGEMPADGFDYHVAFLSEGQLLVKIEAAPEA